MLILDRLLVGGIKFVLGKLQTAVEQELDDDGTLRERLLEAQLRLESGELSADEFAELEATILDRLREIRSRGGGGEGLAVVPSGMRITGIEAEFAADEIHEAALGGVAEPPRKRAPRKGTARKGTTRKGTTRKGTTRKGTTRLRTGPKHKRR